MPDARSPAPLRQMEFAADGTCVWLLGAIVEMGTTHADEWSAYHLRKAVLACGKRHVAENPLQMRMRRPSLHLWPSVSCRQTTTGGPHGVAIQS